MSAAEIEVKTMTERDARCMNHMDPDTKAVHIRLEAWASWAREGEVREYPSVSLLGRVIDQGLAGAGQHGRPPIVMPDPIARIDSAVARLGVIDRRVIEAYYVKPWQPPNVMARRHGMRIRQFQNVLRRARWRIQGYLGALEG